MGTPDPQLVRASSARRQNRDCIDPIVLGRSVESSLDTFTKKYPMENPKAYS
jgi:hypothetical protein